MSEAAPVRPLSRLQKWVIAFGLLSMGVGFTISFVVAPPLARSAGLTELQVAGMLTLSSLLFAFMTPVWGRISGRIGRKRVIWLGHGDGPSILNGDFESFDMFS